MKNTKLFLGVLIAALVLGFASCKQETQDVNVLNPTYKDSASYEYTVSGTYGSVTLKSGIITVTKNYNKTVDTNVESYTISGTAYTTGATASPVTINTSFKRVSGKYVKTVTATSGEVTYANISSFFTGVPTDNTWKVKAAASAENNPFGATEVDLTFKRL